MNSRTAARSRSAASRSARAASYFCGGRDDGLERFELLAGPFDGVVRLGEVVEVADDVADPVGRVARFEHVVADEVVEVADGLHRDGLVEQLQRLLGADPEEAPQRGGVLGELVEDLGSGAAQALAQVAQVRAEVGEVGGDRQRLAGGDEEAVGLAGAVALLEDLGQGDRLVVAVVGEDAEDHRVGPPAGRAGRSARDVPVDSLRSDL